MINSVESISSEKIIFEKITHVQVSAGWGSCDDGEGRGRSSRSQLSRYCEMVFVRRVMVHCLLVFFLCFFPFSLVQICKQLADVLRNKYSLASHLKHLQVIIQFIHKSEVCPFYEYYRIFVSEETVHS